MKKIPEKLHNSEKRRFFLKQQTIVDTSLTLKNAQKHKNNKTPRINGSQTLASIRITVDLVDKDC